MKRILIINQYSSNKGDRAVLYALIKLLDKYDNIEITVSTSTISDWDNTFSNNNIKFVPWGWDYHQEIHNPLLKLKFFLLRRIWRLTYTIIRIALVRNLNFSLINQLINPVFLDALKNSDLVLSTGGHHITTILAQNAISTQMFDLASCLIYKKKTVLWSQSIGPLEFTSKPDQQFVTEVIKKIDTIYVRDKKSVEELSQLGINCKNIHLTFETVLSLNKQIQSYTSINKRKNVIGISIYSTVNRSEEEIKKYVNSISKLADYCVEKTQCDIVFLPMELKNSGPDDRWLIKEILNNIVHKEKCTIIDIDMNTEDHFYFIQNCRYFIGHKTHSVIFALAAATPLIAIAYHPKTTEFMKQFGVEKFAIADLDLSPEKLISLFINLMEDADAIGEKIFERSREIATIIQNDFNSMIIKHI